MGLGLNLGDCRKGVDGQFKGSHLLDPGVSMNIVGWWRQCRRDLWLVEGRGVLG